MGVVGALDADPPLVAAINQIVSLGGLHRLADADGLHGTTAFRGTSGVMGLQAGDAGQQSTASAVFAPTGRGHDWSQTGPEGLSGFSLRFGEAGQQRNVISIESLVRRGTLMLELGTTLGGPGQVSAYRMTMLDGAPLPDWLRLAGPDLVVLLLKGSGDFLDFEEL